MALIIDKNEKIGSFSVYLKLFKLHKSFLLMISDQEDMGIGNVTLGSPPIYESVKSPTTSYNIFGVKSNLLSTIISERASFILKLPVLLLLFLKTKISEEEIIQPLIYFINNTLESIIE